MTSSRSLSRLRRRSGLFRSMNMLKNFNWKIPSAGMACRNAINNSSHADTYRANRIIDAVMNRENLIQPRSLQCFQHQSRRAANHDFSFRAVDRLAKSNQRSHENAGDERQPAEVKHDARRSLGDQRKQALIE